MYRDSSVTTTIDMFDIYSSIDANNELRQHKLRIRGTVETIFEDWIEKKYIKTFLIRKAIRDIKGYDIELIPEMVQKMRIHQD